MACSYVDSNNNLAYKLLQISFYFNVPSGCVDSYLMSCLIVGERNLELNFHT